MHLKSVTVFLDDDGAVLVRYPNKLSECFQKVAMTEIKKN